MVGNEVFYPGNPDCEVNSEPEAWGTPAGL